MTMHDEEPSVVGGVIILLLPLHSILLRAVYSFCGALTAACEKPVMQNKLCPLENTSGGDGGEVFACFFPGFVVVVIDITLLLFSCFYYLK